MPLFLFSLSLAPSAVPPQGEGVQTSEKAHSTVLHYFLQTCSLAQTISNIHTQSCSYCILLHWSSRNCSKCALHHPLQLSSSSSPSNSLELFTLLTLPGLRPGTSSVGPGRELQSTQRAKCCNNDQTWTHEPQIVLETSHLKRENSPVAPRSSAFSPGTALRLRRAARRSGVLCKCDGF